MLFRSIFLAIDNNQLLSDVIDFVNQIILLGVGCFYKFGMKKVYYYCMYGTLFMAITNDRRDNHELLRLLFGKRI